MTRLYYEVVKDIPSYLDELDVSYLAATGHDLLGLAARTAGISRDEAVTRMRNITAAVVPVTSGKGVIPGFSKAVESILNHIGLTAFVTGKPDIAGIGEAFRKEAQIMFSADDQKFLAFNLHSRKVVDNYQVTASVFAQAMAAAAEMESGGLAGARVLVIGLGPVGSYAALELKRIGALVSVFDIDGLKTKSFVDSNDGIQAVSDLRLAAGEISYIYDATPAPEIIDDEMIQSSSVISCPGVPHGLTAAALVKIGPRFMHDVLPLGVAAMALQCI